MAKSRKIRLSQTQANWLALEEGRPLVGAVEARLYTDAWLTGQPDQVGPYKFINLIAHAGFRLDELKPAAVVRAFNYETERTIPSWETTVADHYHGGDQIDEITALTSLALGIRLKAGPVDRWFEPHGDPLGRPVIYGSKREPVLGSGERQLFSATGSHDLMKVGFLGSFPSFKVEDANALLKSARQYQNAIWIADADPALAWLMLVSAVETAAHQYWGSQISPMEKVTNAFPDLLPLLKKSRRLNLFNTLAKILAPITGATKEFRDFLVHFAPPPPDQRPQPYLQFKFDRDNLLQAARHIYKHRSRALHGGTAIPLPMCIPPRAMPGSDVLQEIPIGLGMSAGTANWNHKETPMLLHIFEYIARGCIMSWWSQLNKA